jgi:hypothetical protein
MNENDINPSRGDLETIRNSLASHLSYELVTHANTVLQLIGKFLKGWNKEELFD